MTESYKSTIRPFILTMRIVFLVVCSILMVLLCVKIDNISISIILVVYVLLLASCLDSLQISESGITINRHYIWGWSKKYSYSWSEIKYIGFRSIKYGAHVFGTVPHRPTVYLVIRLKKTKKEFVINHLDFDPSKAGAIIKRYSKIPKFEVRSFMQNYRNAASYDF